MVGRLKKPDAWAVDEVPDNASWQGGQGGRYCGLPRWELSENYHGKSTELHNLDQELGSELTSRLLIVSVAS